MDSWTGGCVVGWIDRRGGGGEWMDKLMHGWMDVEMGG